MSYYDEINARSQVPLSILSGHGAIEDVCAEVDRLRLALAAARDEAEKAKADTARLDWMQEHAASVEVDDEEVLRSTVQASDDFKATGHADPYDIRAAIDAARADSVCVKRSEQMDQRNAVEAMIREQNERRAALEAENRALREALEYWLRLNKNAEGDADTAVRLSLATLAPAAPANGGAKL